MLLLDNPIQPYAWGPVDGIARLVGSAPSGEREAELWVGTHPRGPSVVAAGPLAGRTLADVVAEDPERWLGSELAAAGRRELPFLLKVLAIGSPLSLQAHPSADQAAAGFAREEAEGVPADATHRLYADAGAKPEMLVPLEPTWVLTGFRAPDQAASLVADLDAPALAPLVEALGRGTVGERLEGALAWLLHLQGDERHEVARQAVEAARRAIRTVASAPEREGDPSWWVARLGEEHPGDPTCLAPCLLELRRLGDGGPAEVVLPAGNLHAYLRGAGIEVMAASDNVLRGGLTPKHVEVDELLHVLRFEPMPPSGPLATLSSPGVERRDAGHEEFGLVTVRPGATSQPYRVVPRGPSLLLATGGPVVLDDGAAMVEVGHGQAAFVPPGHPPVLVDGTGTLWWATTRDGLPA